MINQQTVDAVVKALEYLSDPANALGIWLATTGIIAGAHLLTPVTADQLMTPFAI